MFIAAQFTIAECWKQPKCPSVNEWSKKIYGTFTKWNSMQQKEKGAPTLCDSMDGTGEHYAEWNKPGSERQTPYDLTYKWNLINKTSKQAKYNQSHCNKEQTDSNQRGGGRRITGEKGKGYQRTSIKDTWTKPKGVGMRVRGEDGWGSGAWWAEMGTTVLEQQ